MTASIGLTFATAALGAMLLWRQQKLVYVRRELAERRRTERELHESEERYRDLVDSMQDIFYSVSTSGAITFVSKQVQRYGFDPETLVGQSFAEFIFADDRLRVLARFRHTLTTGDEDLATFRIAAPDGRVVWVEKSGHPSRDAAGNIVGISGMLRDVTERKLADADRARLTTAMEQAAETIVITDGSGNIVYVNPSFERTSGYRRDEVLGRNPRLLSSGKQDRAFYAQLWNTISRGEVWHGQLINRRKNGSLYHEDATISPVRDATGAIVNYVALKLDVTHERELEAQLRQSQKLESLGTLAGGVAHEINNPIMGIMGYAQIIRDEVGPDSPLAEFAADIGKEAERVATIVRNLLSFARAEQRAEALPTSLRDVVEDTLSLVRTVLRHDQIELKIDVPLDLPNVPCRSQQIQQVVMNLITNARDALNEKYPGKHENKTITISAYTIAEDGRPWVRLTVEDRGPGVPGVVRERMFEPFFTTKPRGKGTGLGLSVSYGIIEEHQGRVSVDSEPGQWTRFHMDLPACSRQTTDIWATA